MFEINLKKKLEKNSPYVVDLRISDKEAESPVKRFKKLRQKIWYLFCLGSRPVIGRLIQLINSIKSVRIGWPKVGRIEININPSRYHQHKILQMLSHLLAFIIVAGVLVFPLLTFWGYRGYSATKGRVLGEAVSIVSEFKGASLELQNFNWSGSRQHFANSYQILTRLKADLAEGGGLITLLVRLLPKGRSYHHLFEAGLNLSQAGYLLSDSDLTAHDKNLTVRLNILNKRLTAARPYLLKANNHLAKVRIADLPQDQQNQVDDLKLIIAALSGTLEANLESINNLALLLGHNKTQRYLLLFQNNLELRPTGGFIGSLAILDLDQGRIKRLEVPAGGSYDYNYGLAENILSPKPLRIINPRWEIQDCNWFPDFPSSAQKCAWFLEKGVGTSVDGVMAISLPVIVDLLKVLGEIEMPTYQVIVNDHNFIFITQTLVESSEARASGTPKQFLSDFSPILMQRLEESLEDSQQGLAILEVILTALLKKDILLSVADDELQSWLEQNNWSGKIVDEKLSSQPISDYLYVNAATVNGGKSDFNIRQQITHELTVQADGALVNAVEIKRWHLGKRLDTANNLTLTPAEKDFNWLTTQPNLSYIRLYVPAGSQLIEVSGDIFDAQYLIKSVDDSFKEDEFLQQQVQDPMVIEASNTRLTIEFNKTVFGNYLRLDPGETGRLIFKYQLPFKLADFASDQYQLTVQKQPGISSEFICRVEGEVVYQGVLDRDILISN